MSKDKFIDYEPRTGRVNNPPQQIFIEVTGRCNLACIHCCKDYGLPEAKLESNLPLETIKLLVPWFKKTRFINLNVIGEPLLSPHFNEIVRLSCRSEAEVSFNTNALLLSDRKCEFFVDQGVHAITISFDGMESNQRVRGVRYEVIRDRLLKLAAARERAGSNKPYIGIAYTLMRHNIFELPRLLKDILPRVQIHAVHVQPLIIYYETLRGENIYDDEDIDQVAKQCREIAVQYGTQFTLYRSQFLQDERNLERDLLVQKLGPHSEVYGCTDPFFAILILSTGEVISCCYGIKGGDNVNEKDISEIWNGSWYRNLRKTLYAGRFEELCAHCPFIHGSARNQLDPLRPGVHHSQEQRFFNGHRPDV